MATQLLTNSFQPQNFYDTTLSADMTAADTDVFLSTVPTNSEGTLVIDPDSASNREIIYYSSKTATKVVCPSNGRGYDNTTATTHTQGTRVIMAPVADWFNSMRSLFTTTSQGWTATGVNLSSVTYNGNRSYTGTFASTMAAILSPGMRLRTTRTVAAPTQCTSLNGTTQYYSKSSPSGVTFTDTWTVMAWVKLTAYGTSNTIMSRGSSTSNGWDFVINSSGQLVSTFRGAGVTYKVNNSYQSVPLNKWVHVAMSHTASTNVATMYIDGVSVPVVASVSGGTPPTVVTQAGDLLIGATVGPSSFFTGKLAQVALFSAIISASTIRSYMSQGLAGTETSIVSAYSFNGVITDLNTTNANNLTANGSAVATTADSPFGTQADGSISSTLDYGIIQSVSTTTVTWQVPEGDTVPTSGGVTSVSYSTQKAPYGMPVQRARWQVVSLQISQNNSGSIAASAISNVGNFQLSAPVGDGLLGYEATSQLNPVSGNNGYYSAGLSTANNTKSDLELVSAFNMSSGTTISSNGGLFARSKPVSNSSVQVYYLNWQNDLSVNATIYVPTATLACKIYWEPSSL